MTAATQLKPVPKPVRLRRMTLENFRAWKPTDGWKYVWENGIIQKDKNMVSEKQLFIVKNLTRFFNKTKAYDNGCECMPEVEMPTYPNKIRIPDISFYTPLQLRAKHENWHTDRISEFVVEVISEHDEAIKVEQKLHEYFAVGVKVVWQIFPEYELVKIYTSIKNVTICTDDDICSAAPVVPEFAISIQDIFKKP